VALTMYTHVSKNDKQQQKSNQPLCISTVYRVFHTQRPP
jgi:hypothetical protein